MDRDAIIAEARRLFESEKTLRIPDNASIETTANGAWVQALVFVPEPKAICPRCGKTIELILGLAVCPSCNWHDTEEG